MPSATASHLANHPALVKQLNRKMFEAGAALTLVTSNIFALLKDTRAAIFQKANSNTMIALYQAFKNQRLFLGYPSSSTLYALQPANDKDVQNLRELQERFQLSSRPYRIILPVSCDGVFASLQAICLS